jgi:O-acetyl-ADP-ribose deacetylase (regulator of RNase III)
MPNGGSLLMQHHHVKTSAASPAAYVREVTMITYVECDLFLSPARVLVNTVNTVGVMGKGIAKDFKEIYPEMFREYQVLCERKKLDIGMLWLYKTPNKWVLNVPTKKHWRNPSRPEYVEACLRKFVEIYPLYGITSISFPLLGCGNGELDWETQVRPLMEKYLNPLPITVFIHLQHRRDPFTPEHRDIRVMREWLRGEPGSLAFAEVWDDLIALLKHSPESQRLDNGEKFSVRPVPEGHGLALEIGPKTIALPEEAVMDLWQQLRQAGFVSGESMPSGLSAVSGYMVAILSKLPYVKPVQMADRDSKVNTRAIGLRLELKSQTGEHPLFANVGVVEPR